jgi:hypothetical protein
MGSVAGQVVHSQVSPSAPAPPMPPPGPPPLHSHTVPEYVHGEPFMSSSHIAPFMGAVVGQTLHDQVPSGPIGGPPHSHTLPA